MLILESGRTVVAARFSDAVPALMTRPARRPLLVHSVYRSTINILIDEGLLTLARPEDGGLPNGILVELGPDHRALGMRSGMAVTASDGEIHFPAVHLRIVLPPGRGWSPRFDPDLGRPDEARRRWLERAGEVRTAAALLARRRTKLGLGPLLEGRRLGATDPTTARIGPVELGQPELLARAGQALALLRRAVETGDEPRAVNAAGRLIGLGPGLTPSGDDALAGFLAALHATGHPMAGFATGALGDIGAQTTAVAATLLRHAVAGAFAECVHDLLAGLLDPDRLAAVPAMERAAARGATSGIDCLVGVLDGLDAAASRPGWVQ